MQLRFYDNNILRGSKEERKQLVSIIGNLETLVYGSADPNLSIIYTEKKDYSLQQLLKMILIDREDDETHTCSYLRRYDTMHYWDQRFYKYGIDFETYKNFLESEDCICGFCVLITPDDAPVPQYQPPQPSPKSNVSLNVVSFDDSRGLYRELTHNFILKQRSDGIIEVLGTYKDNEVAPLSLIEIGVAEALGLVVIDEIPEIKEPESN